MAATIANVENLGFAGPGGPWKYGEITLDSAYATGGETVNAVDFGYKFFKAMFFAEQEDGYILQTIFSADKTSVLIKVWIGANATTSASVGVEVNTRDLSAVVIPVLVRGI